METLILPIASRNDESSCDFDFVKVTLTKDDIINTRWCVGLKDFGNAPDIRRVVIGLEGNLQPCNSEGHPVETDFRPASHEIVIQTSGDIYISLDNKYDSFDIVEFGPFDIYSLPGGYTPPAPDFNIISGIFVSDGTTFEGYKVSTLPDPGTDDDDQNIFFYGVSREELTESLTTGKIIGSLFVVTDIQ